MADNQPKLDVDQVEGGQQPVKKQKMTKNARKKQALKPSAKDGVVLHVAKSSDNSNSKTKPPRDKGKEKIRTDRTKRRVVSPGAGPSNPDTAGNMAGQEKKGVDLSDTAGKTAGPKDKAPRTVAANFSAMYIPVKCSGGKQEILEKMGFTVKQRPNMHFNPHAVSAGVRYGATAYALSQMYKTGSRKILSIFGSSRDEQIVTYLQSGVKEDLMTLKVYRPMLTAQDINREVSKEAEVFSYNPQEYDGFLLNDIYAFEQDELTPQIIRLIARYGPVYWIGHRFNGAYGTIHGEGAWLRTCINGRDVIVSRPDAEPETAPYPNHDPLDWMTPSGVDGDLAWAQSRVYSDTVIMRFQVTDIPFRNMQSQPPMRYRWIDLSIPTETWMTRAILYYAGWNVWTRRWLTTCPVRRVVVDVAQLVRLRKWLCGRARTLHVYRQLCAHAQKSESDPLLSKIFPEQTLDILKDTCYAAFYNDLDSLEYEAGALHVMDGEKLMNFNLAQSVMAEKPEKGNVPWAKLLCGAVALVAAQQVYRGIRTAWTYFAETRKETALQTVDLPYRNIPIRMLHEPETIIEFAKGDIGENVLDPYISRMSFGQKALYHLGNCMLEEKIKRLHPAIGFAFPLVELLGKFFLYPEANPYILGGVASTTVCMHWYTTTLPYWKGVAVHWCWNMVCLAMSEYGAYRLYFDSTRGEARSFLPFALICTCATAAIAWLGYSWWSKIKTPVSRWGQFKKHYHFTPWEHRGGYPEVLPCVSEFDLLEGFVPASATSHYDTPVQDTSLVIEKNFEKEVEHHCKTGVYWFFPTPVPWYSAGRTDANLLAVVEARITAEPPLDPLKQAHHWESMRHFVHVPEVPQQVLTYETASLMWIHKFQGAKRRRAEEALQRVQDSPLNLNDYAVRKVKVMVKTDEILCKVLDDGTVGLKPRAIMPVDPQIQAEIGPWMLIVTENVKAQWTWDLNRQEPYVIYTDPDVCYSVYFTYAGDATDYLLTKWMAQVLLLPNGSITILVAGDDSLVIIRTHDGRLIVLEADFGMYDQSQSSGPLDFQAETQEILGMPLRESLIERATHDAEIIGQSCHKEFSARIRVKHEDRPQRTTGGPATSFGNTTNNGQTWGNVIEQFGITEQGILEGFRYYGFKLKLKIFEDIRQCTFLKGMWYENSSVEYPYIWGPLISRFLKMGKSFRDPCTLFSGTRKEATWRFAHDVALSYNRYLSVPLVSDFVYKFRGFGRYEKPEYADDAMKVQSEGFACNYIAEHSQVMERYGLDEEDLWDMQHMIMESPPGSFLEHPGFVKLAQVDYN